MGGTTEADTAVEEHGGTPQRQVLIALAVGCVALAAGLYLLRRLEQARIDAANAPDAEIGEVASVEHDDSDTDAAS